MHDFYPGFKEEEKCFSSAIINDVDQNKSRKKKSDLEQEPMTWPRLKSSKETAYERFLEEVINPKTGKFYPEIKDKIPVPKTGALYFYTDITRIRRDDGSEFLYTKGRVYAYNSRGDPVTHFISKPEIWTRTNFNYKTEYNDKTKEFEKVLQGPSGSEEVYTMPFTKENLKQLYDRRQSDLINFIVKQEARGEAREVKEVNSQKTLELFEKDFSYLWNGNYISPEQKAAYRQEAIDRGWIQAGSNTNTGNNIQPSGTNPKTNTYQ